jgi:two-component system chemotaxis response regulator CheB
MSGRKIVCIGGSNGAPMLALSILEKLPAGFGAPILLALHMPPPLTASFTHALSTKIQLKTSIAVNETLPEPGEVYVCPGGMHIGLSKTGRIIVTPKPDGTPFKPSIDILFHTAAQNAQDNVIAVVLKGLTVKRDARQGALSVKNNGGRVVVQGDRADTIFGMPRDVIDAGAATEVLPLADIPKKLISLVG